MNTLTRFSLTVMTGLVLFACQPRPTPRSTPPASTLELVIAANPQTYSQAGQAISYTYSLTNLGSVPLGPAQFTVSATLSSAPFPCGPANTTLAPNQSLSCTTVYTITQADMSLAELANSATGSGGGQTSATAASRITNAAAPPSEAAPTLATTADLTQRPPIRIILEAGQTTATLSAVINPNETISYILRAAQGQVLSINLTTGANEITLGVDDPAGTVLKPADTTRTWSTSIHTDGDYVIDIVSPAIPASASYVLEVRLETSP